MSHEIIWDHQAPSPETPAAPDPATAERRLDQDEDLTQIAVGDLEADPSGTAEDLAQTTEAQQQATPTAESAVTISAEEVEGAEHVTEGVYEDAINVMNVVREEFFEVEAEEAEEADPAKRRLRKRASSKSLQDRAKDIAAKLETLQCSGDESKALVARATAELARQLSLSSSTASNEDVDETAIAQAVKQAMLARSAGAEIGVGSGSAAAKAAASRPTAKATTVTTVVTEAKQLAPIESFAHDPTLKHLQYAEWVHQQLLHHTIAREFETVRYGSPPVIDISFGTVLDKAKNTILMALPTPVKKEAEGTHNDNEKKDGGTPVVLALHQPQGLPPGVVLAYRPRRVVTTCATFVALAIKQGFGLTQRQLNDFFEFQTSKHFALAASYYNRIVRAPTSVDEEDATPIGPFRRVKYVEDCRPGDIIACKFDAELGSSNTGHVMLVASGGVKRRFQKSQSDPPVVEGLIQFVAFILDSTKPPHGATDTRNAMTKAAGRQSSKDPVTGIGHGCIRIYGKPVEGGKKHEPVGYTWSCGKLSPFSGPENHKHIAIGRLNSAALLLL